MKGKQGMKRRKLRLHSTGLCLGIFLPKAGASTVLDGRGEGRGENHTQMQAAEVFRCQVDPVPPGPRDKHPPVSPLESFF